MANAYTNYNQTVFINGTKLRGVRDFSANYNIRTKPINVVGQGVVNQVTADIPEASVSITRDISFVDYFQAYTGLNIPINGSIHYNDKILGFQEGHLTSYSYSVEYGQTPVSNIGITVFGEMGSGDANSSINDYGSLNASGQAVEGVIQKITRPSDISVSCFGSTTNRVKSFSFDVAVPKLTAYALNHKYPVQVSMGNPIVVNSSFVMEVDDYESRRISDYLTLTNFDSFSINVKGIIYGANILTEVDGTELTMPDGTFLTLLSDDTYQVSQLWNFNSSNTRLISQDFSSSADDVSQVSLTYQTFLNRQPL